MVSYNLVVITLRTTKENFMSRWLRQYFFTVFSKLMLNSIFLDILISSLNALPKNHAAFIFLHHLQCLIFTVQSKLFLNVSSIYCFVSQEEYKLYWKFTIKYLAEVRLLHAEHIDIFIYLSILSLYHFVNKKLVRKKGNHASCWCKKKVTTITCPRGKKWN